MRIPDDPTLVTPVFEFLDVPDLIESKKQGRPIYNQIEICRIFLPANKYTAPVYPAHEVAGKRTELTDYGEDEIEITYAMKYNKQYLEFKAGGKQSISGTLLSELPFINSAKRKELMALNIHTAEQLAALDGSPLKMLGPNGRDMKNQAAAYLETAAKNVGVNALASELSLRDTKIADLERKLASLAPVEVSRETSAPTQEAAPVTQETVTAFETFEDDDIRAWLADAGVTVDGRWGRNTLIAKSEEILAVQGRKKHAA